MRIAVVKCQQWPQVSIRTWCLSLHHLPLSPTPGKLTEWNTNLDLFALAGSLLLPIQVLLLAAGAVLRSPKESPSSTTPPIEISSSRLTKLTRRTTDRKSEFLKTLKDERNGDCSESRDCDKLEGLRLEGSHTPEPKENGEQGCLQNGLSLPMVEEGEVLSHSLEAEHR